MQDQTLKQEQLQSSTDGKRSPRDMDKLLANHYFRQICEGLDYLHSLNIIHNNIKPDNLLINCEARSRFETFASQPHFASFGRMSIPQSLPAAAPTTTTWTKIGHSLSHLAVHADCFPILQCMPIAFPSGSARQYSSAPRCSTRASIRCSYSSTLPK